MTVYINYDVMCSMAKPLWGSGKKVIMVGVLFVLKRLLVCLRESSMEVNYPRRIVIVQQKFMDMESMPIEK